MMLGEKQQRLIKTTTRAAPAQRPEPSVGSGGPASGGAI